MIRPLVKGDADIIAAIHSAELRTDLSGCTGRKLLTSYYRALSQGQGAIGYVWLDERETVSGFVCGIWDVGRLRRALLSGELLGLLLWGAAYLIMHPWAVLKPLQRLTHSVVCFRKNTISQGSAKEYWLRPIAVRAHSGRRGVGSALLQRLLDDARSRRFSSVHLQTEMDNDAANAFYRKALFSLESTTDGYHHYSIRLGERAHPASSCPNHQATPPQRREGSH